MLLSWAKKLLCKLLPLFSPFNHVSNFYFRYDFLYEKNQYVLDMCSCTSFYIQQDTTAEMGVRGNNSYMMSYVETYQESISAFRFLKCAVS
jgi:hypothetical protein